MSNNNKKEIVFTCRGKFWDVPENHEFLQRTNMRNGLALLLYSQNLNEEGSLKVKLFKYLSLSLFPSQKLRNKHKLHWKPVLLKSDSILIDNSIEVSDTASSEVISFVHGKVYEHCKINTECVF